LKKHTARDEHHHKEASPKSTLRAAAINGREAGGQKHDQQNARTDIGPRRVTAERGAPSGHQHENEKQRSGSKADHAGNLPFAKHSAYIGSGNRERSHVGLMLE
jgi:hypothetical protein